MSSGNAKQPPSRGCKAREPLRWRDCAKEKSYRHCVLLLTRILLNILTTPPILKLTRMRTSPSALRLAHIFFTLPRVLCATTRLVRCTARPRLWPAPPSSTPGLNRLTDPSSLKAGLA